MTNTLYQNIQTLGNRMAENLTTMGVESTFNEGGLTLANKILQINKFNDGILLTAEKDIIQTSNTDRLIAVHLQDGKLVADNITIYQIRGNFSNPLTSNSNGFSKISSYSGNDMEITANGAVISDSSRIYCTYPFNLTRDKAVISLKCKADTGSTVALCGQIGYSTGGDDYASSFSIDDTHADIAEQQGNLPSGTDITDWIDVTIIFTPTHQEIYINDSLASSADMDWASDTYRNVDNYFTVWDYNSNHFMMKDFSIDVKRIIASGSDGYCSGIYTGSGIGKVEFIAVAGTE